MPEKRKQNDDWNRDSKQPEKNSSTHDGLLSLYVEWENSVVPGTIAQRTVRLPLLASGENPASTVSWAPAVDRLSLKSPAGQSGSEKSLEMPTTSAGTRAVRLIGPSVGPLTPQFQDRLSEPPCGGLTRAQAEHDSTAMGGNAAKRNGHRSHRCGNACGGHAREASRLSKPPAQGRVEKRR